MMAEKKINGTDIADSVISSILATGQIFGINHIASILVGSNSQKVLKYRHEKLPMHSSLEEYSFEQIKEFIRELITQGYLEQTQDEYPVLKLLTKSNGVLAGKKQVKLKKPSPDLARKPFMSRGESVSKTLELFKSGKTVLEISLERELAQETILSHLAEAFQNGEKTIDIDQFVPADKQQAIAQEFDKTGFDYLSPVKRSLGPDYTWEDLRWVKAKLMRQQASNGTSI